MRRRVPWELALALAVQLLFLGHALKTYFVDDDAINRATSGALANEHVSYWTAVDRLMSSWWTYSGRFFPVSFYTGPPQFMMLHDARAYKALLLVWTAAAGVCVWLLLRELGVGRAGAALVLVVATIAIQFRPQDPVLAYQGLEQFVLAQMALSLLFFHRWLRLGRRRHLVFAVALLVVSSLTYESSYVFGPLYALLALARRRQLLAAGKALIPVAVPSIVFIAIGSYGRAHAAAGSSGPYAPSFDPHEVAATLLDQFSAALPLIYAGFDPSHLLHPFGSVVAGSLSVWDVALGLLFGVATVVLARRVGARADWSPLLLVALGAGLWVLTAAPIALARRYQAELVAGLGHIPVIIECFAFGMVVVGLAAAVARRGWSPAVRTAGVAVLAVVVGGLAALGHRANAVVVANLQPARTIGLTLERTAATAMRDRIAAGSKVYVNPAETWNSAAFYRQYSGRKFVVKPLDPAKIVETARAAGPCTPGRPATWWVRAGAVTPTAGYALVACAGGPGAQLVLHGAAPERTAVSALGPPVDPRHAPQGTFGLASDVRLDGLRAGVDPFAFFVADVGNAAVMAEWTGGCWVMEETSRGIGRWCERHAAITVVATAGRTQRATLTLPIAAVGTGARRVVVSGPGGLRVVASIGTPLTIPLTVPAHGGVRLEVRLEGGHSLPGVTGGRHAWMFVGPAIAVS